MPGSRSVIHLLILLTILVCVAVFPQPVGAQSETGYDVIAQVNQLRASKGLAPYTIDPWIMDYAQQHTQYQADIQTSTHTHSDGSVSLSVGLQENVAGGTYGFVTAAIVVYEIWQDWGHLNPMIGYQSGEAGAGVAVDTNNTVYYTLNVRPGPEVGSPSASTTGAAAQPVAAALQQPTAAFVPLTTAAPAADGSVTHEVGEGQTMWSIAVSYGVTMTEIQQLNGMAADNTSVYTGQKLIIYPVGSFLEPTGTSMPEPTMTPTPDAAALTASAPTAIPTPIFTPTPLEEESSLTGGTAGRVVAWIIAAAAGILLLALALVTLSQK